MNGIDWRQILRDDLDRLRHAHLHRQRRVICPIDATHVTKDGQRFIDFTSNDYLGLSHHPRVIQAARHAIERDGFGSGAAPLISGYGQAHADAENAIAQWKGTESAVLLSSGFAANVAAVQGLASLGGRFLMDKLCHASLVDAVRQSGQPFRVYPHNHLIKLRRLLADAPRGQVQIVVTESIFSMDGDSVDLAGLADLKSRYSFVLLLDEAHASGVYGPHGAGLAAERALQAAVDVTVVTLSKAIGCIGGAVCAERVFCDAVVNHGRPYIYSTGLPAAAAAGAQAAIEVMRSEPERQNRLRTLARQVRAALYAQGRSIPSGDSPIIPVILGTEQAALQAAEHLASQGLLVQPIRPPTVPKGASRLRLTLCCEHTDEQVAHLLGAIGSL